LCRISSDWCDKHALQKQFGELTEKSKEENYVIKGKLAISDQVMDTVNS
jgi:hypothetical protein